jgi:glutathione S-transferase
LRQALRIVEAVDDRVADGRRFLWGDRLTLSDISFATALAPFLLPPGYAAPIPDLPQMPPVMQEIVTSFRQRPSGELVTRIYQARDANKAGEITP